MEFIIIIAIIFAVINANNKKKQAEQKNYRKIRAELLTPRKLVL